MPFPPPIGVLPFRSYLSILRPGILGVNQVNIKILTIPPYSGRRDDLQPKIMFFSTPQVQLVDGLRDGACECTHAAIREDRDRILTAPE